MGYSPWGHKRVGHDLATQQQQQQFSAVFHTFTCHGGNLHSSQPRLKLFSPSSDSYVTFLFEWSMSLWTYMNSGNCSGQSWEPAS